MCRGVESAIAGRIRFDRLLYLLACWYSSEKAGTMVDQNAESGMECTLFYDSVTFPHLNPPSHVKHEYDRKFTNLCVGPSTPGIVGRRIHVEKAIVSEV